MGTSLHEESRMKRLIKAGFDALGFEVRRRRAHERWTAETFGKPALHEKMLLDGVRCKVYKDALARTVQPGDVVVDLGAGTGFLSFFSIQAGEDRSVGDRST